MGMRQLALTALAVAIAAAGCGASDQQWNTEGKNGSVNALVGKRFLLSTEGSNIPDVKALHAIAARIDLNKLAAWK
jgi:hypothetical protein